ncbi:MAG TPA: alpha/beta hydrolase [Acidimicrobiia bacterium]
MIRSQLRRRPLLALVATVTLAAAASGCALTVSPPGPAPLRYRDPVFSTVNVTSNIAYGTAVDQEGNTDTLQLDMYAPKGDTETSRPAIVWVHGGSFCCLDKTSPELVDEATTFAKEGYVNVSINYRLYPQGCSAGGVTAGCIEAIVQATNDAQTAVRWLRANATKYGIDPSRIAIGGSSAGAITAMNVAFASTQFDKTGSNQGYSSAVGAAMSLSGARLYGTVDANDAPTLDFHGTADPLVPYAWAVSTQKAALAAGLQSYLVTWQGDGHVPYAQHRDEILLFESNFLYWELDLADIGTPLTAAGRARAIAGIENPLGTSTPSKHPSA